MPKAEMATMSTVSFDLSGSDLSFFNSCIRERVIGLCKIVGLTVEILQMNHWSKIKKPCRSQKQTTN